MEDIKAIAAARHEEAASHFEHAAKMHRDAAKHCAAGNYEKAMTLATSAAEAETAANRNAFDAMDLYRHHSEDVASHKAEIATEEAARDAKRDAKAAGE